MTLSRGDEAATVKKWALRWNHGSRALVAGMWLDPVMFDTRSEARNYRLRYMDDPIPMPSIVRVQVTVEVLG